MAVNQLNHGAYAAARARLQEFAGVVAAAQAAGALDAQRAADLTAAAGRIVAVL